MESLITSFNSLNFDIDIYSIGKTALILLIGTILLGAVGRFAFGKRSSLNVAVSSAISIIFIYTVSVILRSAGTQFNELLAPLPFVDFSKENMFLFSFQYADYKLICSEILSMVVLALLVNLADGWMPKGKHIITWIIFRILTVIIGFFGHIIVVGLLANYLPDVIVTYAPVVLLALLILLILTGALKVVVGAFLTTVNPIIGGLYTFFFATIIGKQITKAVLTTAILTGLIVLLQYFGITAISIASAALIAYVPLLIILIIVWYIVYKVF